MKVLSFYIIRAKPTPTGFHIHGRQKVSKCQTFSRPNPILVGRFILEFSHGGGLTGAGEEVSACDRYHFRWIPPSDVNSHVVTDDSDLWPIY